MRTILESSRATLRALDDALDFSRAEVGDMRLEAAPVLLREVMDGVEAGWRTRAEREGVTLLVAYDGEPDLNATLDAARLRQVFDKLIEAAVDAGVGGAVEAARTGRFDLILMDIRMPRMDGVEATLAIRDLPGAPGAVPIIALTANADPEDAKVYIASGMHSVVEKPIKPERLLQAINAALPDEANRAAAAA